MAPLVELPTGWATRPTTITRTARRRGGQRQWATRPTTTARMARRLARLPEQGGNAGLNIAPSGGGAVSVAQERDPSAAVAVTRTKTLLVSADRT